MWKHNSNKLYRKTIIPHSTIFYNTQLNAEPSKTSLDPEGSGLFHRRSFRRGLSRRRSFRHGFFRRGVISSRIISSWVIPSRGYFVAGVISSRVISSRTIKLDFQLSKYSTMGYGTRQNDPRRNNPRRNDQRRNNLEPIQSQPPQM
jgi:hypothetical protein